MAEVSPTKWKGEIRETINVPIDEAWAIVGTFCGGSKILLPQCKEEELLEGENNKVNCIKRTILDAPDGSDQLVSVTEKLVERDDEDHALAYTMLDNTLNFTNYAGRIHLVPGVHRTTVVEWTVELDPVPGAPEDAFIPVIMGMLKTGIKTAESYHADKKTSPAAA